MNRLSHGYNAISSQANPIARERISGNHIIPAEQLSHHYFEMIKREHHDLGEAVAAARQAIETEPRDAPAVRAAVQHVCQLVESHFAHEEEGGYDVRVDSLTTKKGS